MELYARVNILDGRAVRLGRGSLDDVVSLDSDPLNRARGWVDKGIDYLLVVDLDAAAYGSYRNRPLIDDMLDRLDVPVVVAGGIRSEWEAGRLVERGAWKVTMGTAAIESPTMVWDLCREYPGRMMVSLDVLGNEELVTRGWTSNSGRFLEEVMLEMASCGVSGFFVTDARRDVLAESPNFEILRTALEYIDEPVIASGGVRHLDDVRMLTSIQVEGRSLAGLVVGQEITEGRFTVSEAKEALRGPVQDSTTIRQTRMVLRCENLDESVAFYEGALGLTRCQTPSPGGSDVSDDRDGSMGPGGIRPADSARSGLESERNVLLELGAGVFLELVSGRLDPGRGSQARPLHLVLMVEGIEGWRTRLAGAGPGYSTMASGRSGSFDVSAPDGVTITICESRAAPYPVR